MRNIIRRTIFQHGSHCYKISATVKSSVSHNVCSISPDRNCYRPIRSVRMAHNKMTINLKSNNNVDFHNLMEVWPIILKDSTEPHDRQNIPEVTKWLDKAMEYQVLNDHLHRALQVVNSYRKLVSPDQLTDDNLKLARILGWCTELLAAYFLLHDDMLDQSTTRRGKPIWPLHSNIGLGAINDRVLLEQAVYNILRQHFKGKDCYVKLLETFHEFTMKIALGQTLDLFSHREKGNVELFTADDFDACVRYKNIGTALPVVSAMYFAGINDPELHRQVMMILQKISHICQVQNDYMDVYGDPCITGKIPNDIQMGKASWLAVVALQCATSQQKQIFMECYGSDDPEKVARIKELYKELELPKIYDAYREESYNSITNDIEKLSDRLPRDLFSELLLKAHQQSYA